MMRKIELGHLRITDVAREYLMDVLDSNRLSSGKYVARFESEFAKEHRCKYGVMCNSGTSALQIALAALKEKYGFYDGDEVIVPAVTFIATSNTVLQNRMMPVFVDIDPIYYNINPDLIEPKITKKTKAIIPVHLFGLPCDMDPILGVVNHYNLRVIEDSCETMFARYKGRPVGSFGDLACFSTYIAHLLVTGVGGLITTNSDELALICRSIMAHGRDPIYLNIDDDDNIQHPNAFSNIINRRFSFIRMGYSYRVTEMEGALGVAQLEAKDWMIQKRKENAEYLIKHLASLSERLQLPTRSSYSDHVFMLFPIVAKDTVDREDLVTFLEMRGIETRYMMPLINQPYYIKLFGNLEKEYPVASRINRKGFYIGCHQGLLQEDLDYIIDVFNTYFRSR